MKEQILARARWRCEACGRPGGLEVHHLVKRSHGGADADPDQLVALCRRCHAMTDAPCATGRLVITALGKGQYQYEVVRRIGDGVSAAEVRTVVPTTETVKTLLKSIGRAVPLGFRS